MRIVLVLFILVAGCGVDGADSAGKPLSSLDGSATTNPATGVCADVVGVEIVSSGDRLYTFHVTVLSADEGWNKYADEWTIRAPDGRVLGTRTLTHPHEDEQPFTRSLSGVEVPEVLDTVVVAARDSVTGYCGASFEIAVP